MVTFEEGLVPAAALRAAQCWLRNATAERLKLAEHWAQVHRTTANAGLEKVAFTSIRYYSLHPQERPFLHPFHWAALTLSGA